MSESDESDTSRTPIQQEHLYEEEHDGDGGKDHAGTWSHRITDEHRLVYLVDDEHLVALQARFHYR